MGLLSADETIVWQRFQAGQSTTEIALESERMITLLKQRGIRKENSKAEWDSSYVSRVLNRTRKKIKKTLQELALSHRLDIESILDYHGLLIGYDYQTNSKVFLIFTVDLGIVVWYKHADWLGKLCPNCPKKDECRETLDTILEEYNLKLRPDEEVLHMTEQSLEIFEKLAAKEIPRYRRKHETKEVDR